MRKKSFNIVVVLVIVASIIISHAQVFSASIATIYDGIDPEVIINLFSNDKKQRFSVYESVKLKCFSTDTYTYTMYSLLPYGYAIILDSTGSLMEACYTETTLPYSLTQGNFYYCGPLNYYSLEGDKLVHTYNNTVLSTDDVLNFSEYECNVFKAEAFVTSEKKKSEMSALHSQEVVRYMVEPNYFSELTEFGYNTRGTCTVLAAAILLGYYDEFVDDSMVPDIYRNGDGTSDSFHKVLMRQVYGTDTPESGGIAIRNALPGLNRYMSSQDLGARFSTEYSSNEAARQKIVDELRVGNPTIASLNTSNPIGNHTVVVYGVSYIPSWELSRGVARIHLGWHNGAEEDGVIITEEETRDYSISLSWFYECGFIDMCAGGHEYCSWHRQDEATHVRECARCKSAEEASHAYYYWSDNSLIYHTGRCSLCFDTKTEEHGPYVTSVGVCSRCGRSGLPTINNFDNPVLY